MWLVDTLCRLRYGKAYTGCTINKGTEFYVYTVNELYDYYKLSKGSGAGDILLDSILDKLIETENINNPQQMQRAYILKNLEPFRHLTKKETVELYNKGLASFDDVRIKINFSSLIQRFERENTDITEFGINIEFDNKINVINQKLKDYVNEEKDNEKQGEAQSD